MEDKPKSVDTVLTTRESAKSAKQSDDDLKVPDPDRGRAIATLLGDGEGGDGEEKDEDQ